MKKESWFRGKQWHRSFTFTFGLKWRDGHIVFCLGAHSGKMRGNLPTTTRHVSIMKLFHYFWWVIMCRGRKSNSAWQTGCALRVLWEMIGCCQRLQQLMILLACNVIIVGYTLFRANLSFLKRVSEAKRTYEFAAPVHVCSCVCAREAVLLSDSLGHKPPK